MVDGFKISLEFKFPKSTNKGGSNQKQVRIKSVNDIKRICYLVNNQSVDIGVFLMVTNESAYSQKGNYRGAKDFLIYQNHSYNIDKEFPIDNDSPEFLLPNKKICIDWFKVNNLFAIKPIIVYFASSNKV
jgi:hypothetical protein